MNFKLIDALDDIEFRALELRRKDLKFELTELDHIWPRTPSQDQRCRCPKHNHATTELRYSCYMRIRAAHNGERLKTAEELAAQLGNLR